MVRKFFDNICFVLEKGNNVKCFVEFLDVHHFCNLLKPLLDYFVRGKISFCTIKARKIDFKYREDCRLDEQYLFTPNLSVNTVYRFFRVTWQPSGCKVDSSVVQENKSWLTPISFLSCSYRWHIQFWNLERVSHYVTIMLPDVDQTMHSREVEHGMVAGGYRPSLIACKSNCVLVF